MAAWLDRMPCPVVNRLRPELWYRPRLNVADLATLAPDLRGYLPPALITTQSDEIRRLPQIAAEEMFYTPLGSGAKYPVPLPLIWVSWGNWAGFFHAVIILENGAQLQCFVAAGQAIYVGPDGDLRGRLPTIKDSMPL